MKELSSFIHLESHQIFKKNIRTCFQYVMITLIIGYPYMDITHVTYFVLFPFPFILPASESLIMSL